MSHLVFGDTPVLGGTPSKSGSLAHQQLPHIILQKGQHEDCKDAAARTDEHLHQVQCMSYVEGERLGGASRK